MYGVNKTMITSHIRWVGTVNTPNLFSYNLPPLFIISQFQVIKTTGFFGNLFEDNELVSENVKDRDSKILFLNKVIFVLSKFNTSTYQMHKPIYKRLNVTPSIII